MNLSKKILLVLVCLGILGCFRQEEVSVPPEIKELIIVGKTTKEEIRDIFGEPTSITGLPRFNLVSTKADIPEEMKNRLLTIEENVPSRLKGGEIWSYASISTKKGFVANSFESAHLLIVFDLEGVVSEYRYRNAKTRY